LDLAGFIQYAVPAIAIPRSKPMVSVCREKFLLCFIATVLTFFIAGLLYLYVLKARR
jgi:hypothetical protein